MTASNEQNPEQEVPSSLISTPEEDEESSRRAAAIKRFLYSPAALLDLEGFFQDLEGSEENLSERVYRDYSNPRLSLGGTKLKRKDTLERRKNFLISFLGDEFIYRPLKVIEPENPDWSMTRIIGLEACALELEGFVFIGRKAYWVTSDDLRRLVVRASRRLNLIAQPLTVEHFKDGTAYSKSHGTKHSSVSATPPGQLGVHGGVSIETEDEELSLADGVLQEQINALFDS